MLPSILQGILFITSLLIVALGRPAVSPWLGVVAFVCGFALFFRSVEGISERKRVFLGFLWYSGVQLVQLEWLLSHPYGYIYAVWFFFSFLWGVQFALLTYLVPKEGEITWARRGALSGLWVLMEWGRLFFLSGFSWNPAGLSPTGVAAFLHVTAFVGVFGLSFLAMLLNLTVLEGLRTRRFWPALVMGIVIGGLGLSHLEYRKREMGKGGGVFTVAMVQTAFPAEEILQFKSVNAMLEYVQEEWGSIYSTLAGVGRKKVDLVVLPELVVPYGTYMPIFLLEEVERRVVSLLGEGGKAAMPELAWPYAFLEKGVWKVTNAFMGQTLANFFRADVLVGLEDAERVSEEEIEHYNAAFLFSAGEGDSKGRYEKRVLVPMGEYIPFSWCRELCKSYGVMGSFTAGKCAKALEGKRGVYGPSICYEETYGHLMRENKEKGVDILCNVTSDIWYPNSLLPEEHLAHARPRTVEMGLPLVRACNTGVTAAVNSLGETVAKLEGEWTRGVLVAEVPLYHYGTLYSYTGDYPVLLLSCFLVCGYGIRRSCYKITK